MTRTLNVDDLTRELAEQAVTINGIEYRLVLKDNAVNLKLRQDSRELAKLGRKAEDLTGRTKQLDDAENPDDAAYAAIAVEEEKVEDQVIALRRRMIAALIRDDEGNAPAAAVLDGLDQAVIGRLFEFVLSDPLEKPASDPTSQTATGGDTPPSS